MRIDESLAGEDFRNRDKWFVTKSRYKAAFFEMLGQDCVYIKILPDNSALYIYRITDDIIELENKFKNDSVALPARKFSDYISKLSNYVIRERKRKL